MVKDLVVQCPQFTEQIVAEDLEEAPASRPPAAAAVSLGLDEVGFEKDPRMMVCSQVGVHPNEASGEPLMGWIDPSSEPNVALMDNKGSLSPDDQDDDPLHVDHHHEVFHQERQQLCLLEVLRRGLVTAGEGLLGAAIAIPSARVQVDSAEGLVLKSILKKIGLDQAEAVPSFC
ncbi:hypothetical protein Nepgr_018701 [Nepenthes gracilis]|uniref:Uncharacterized protein n=1 Tax=Nepenthes gracilis TaxID=150966 RepID=A0AAD3XUI6_NEPGR|nr:hypothetical protein Nepgr_018701 [Nepenthes gracilis]